MNAKPFHEALADALSAKPGYDDRELAKGVSVPKDRVTRWRTGEEVPTRAEFGRVCCHLPTLRGYRDMTFAQKGGGSRVRAVLEPASAPPGAHGPGDFGPDSFGGSDRPDVRFEVEPASAPPPRAETFGDALRREREADGSTQEELGAVLDVAPSTVSGWEREGFAPIKAHYDALLVLYPRLREEPAPDWRAGEKPGPETGATSRRPADMAGRHVAHAEGAEATSPAPLPSGVQGDPAERLLRAFATVHGGSWGLSVDQGDAERGEKPWVVLVRGKAGQYQAEGESVPACYNELYAGLDEVVGWKLRVLEKLRADLRGYAAPSA